MGNVAICKHKWVYDGGSCCNRRVRCPKCKKISRAAGINWNKFEGLVLKIGDHVRLDKDDYIIPF